MFIVQISRKFIRLYIIYPRYRNSLFTVSSSWGECSIFSAAEAIHTVSIFCSTLYPLLLGGQRRCEFKACPRLLHVTSAAGINPRPLDLGSNALTTQPLSPLRKVSCTVHDILHLGTPIKGRL